MARALLPASIFVVYFVLLVVLQASTGAWNAPFNAYPDEPSHFIGSVMVRDYLASGKLISPIDFARHYYEHYPYFAVGYWPPLFYLITGFWFLIAGVGRMQALMISALAAAGSAWLVFTLVRKRAGAAAGFCAGFMLLCLPEVQRWASAVMVDEMVLFFSLGAAALTVCWLERPTVWNGALCGLCCCCAIMTKYSGLYVAVVPLAALLAYRRFHLLRKPGCLIQPGVLTLGVGIWAIWTWELAWKGLPESREGSLLMRLAQAPGAVFHLFPAVLGVTVAAGLLGLILKRRAWGPDLTVICLLSLGAIGFIVVSPVGLDEPRYLLPVAASLIVLGFAGWASWLAPLSRQTRRRALSALGAVLAAAAATHLGDFRRPASEPISAVVQAIAGNPAWAGKRIMVAPDFEGPLIAEFAAQAHHRPAHELLRPSKVLARSDWFGNDYRCWFRTPGEVRDSLSRIGTAVVVWHAPRNGERQQHARLLEEMLANNPHVWKQSASFEQEAGRRSWFIYAYEPKAPAR
ncbi:MAG TPA: glycosyltransferase family 39 protein [Bryobacteraceae bacterium]|nr:glycosyltransferase family 39 protein [Bryobacteraceae bacterium]